MFGIFGKKKSDDEKLEELNKELAGMKAQARQYAANKKKKQEIESKKKAIKQLKNYSTGKQDRLNKAKLAAGKIKGYGKKAGTVASKAAKNYQKNQKRGGKINTDPLNEAIFGTPSKKKKPKYPGL